MIETNVNNYLTLLQRLSFYGLSEVKLTKNNEYLLFYTLGFLSIRYEYANDFILIGFRNKKQKQDLIKHVEMIKCLLINGTITLSNSQWEQKNNQLFLHSIGVIPIDYIRESDYIIRRRVG